MPKLTTLARSRGVQRANHFHVLRGVFRAKLDTDSAANWTVIPPQTGHGFHGKLDTDSTANWTSLGSTPMPHNPLEIQKSLTASFEF
jgi:hypothetical protein